jgi:hypothetical protein
MKIGKGKLFCFLLFINAFILSEFYGFSCPSQLLLLLWEREHPALNELAG